MLPFIVDIFLQVFQPIKYVRKKSPDLILIINSAKVLCDIYFDLVTGSNPVLYIFQKIPLYVCFSWRPFDQFIESEKNWLIIVSLIYFIIVKD